MPNRTAARTGGPQVFFLDADGNPVEGDAIELARQSIRAGKIVAVKGLGRDTPCLRL